MSIEALAMAGVDCHHLNISLEECEKQNPPPYLITRVKNRKCHARSFYTLSMYSSGRIHNVSNSDDNGDDNHSKTRKRFVGFSVVAKIAKKISWIFSKNGSNTRILVLLFISFFLCYYSV
ncbi:hypothetical protein POM88_015643 [Heracleum sosnowskyi]|uniref:Uncharacterized protein n=1 Tax=Heracleum sosnowskyi TaxID=360622 RepID=A0AAD8MS91_9APIA|nr:hypothetical protein POM88_015643 [Heracleum sosnowskyi]